MEIYETDPGAVSSSGPIPLLSPNSDMEWWEYDLQLAAELGKALLERNQELENQLQEAETVNREKQAENQFLSQKLSTLRSLNESRMKMYEQVDTNAQDLEEANRKLRSQSQCDKETVAALTTSLETAESRVESLETQLSTLMNEQKEKEESDQAEMAKQVRFQQDLNCKALQDEVEKLRKELDSSDSHHESERREHDACVCNLMEENKSLNMSLDVLRSKVAHLQSDDVDADEVEGGSLLDDSRAANPKNVSFEKSPEPTATKETGSPTSGAVALKCRLCGVEIEDACKRCLTASIRDEIECDDLDSSLTIKDPVVVRLKHGGSAYGSRESLNKIAIISPENEYGNSVIGVFNVSADNGRSPTSIGEGGSRAMPDLGPESLMSEMGAQYAVLIEKYESILKQKEEMEKSSQRKDATDVAVGTSFSLKLSSSTPNPKSRDDIAAMPKRGLGNVVESVGDEAISRSVQTETIFLDSSSSDGDGRSSTSPSPAASSTGSRKRQCRSLIVTGLEQGRDPTDYGFDHSPPEYKELFKEIFATLRKTVDKESARPPTPPKDNKD